MYDDARQEALEEMEREFFRDRELKELEKRESNSD